MNVRHVVDERGDAGRPLWTRHTVVAVARRPSVWLAAMSGAVRFAPTGWWRRAPFLPAPDPRYWRFRMETAYGDDDAAPGVEDLVTAMRWARRARRRQR
jgi:hypothetical protein